MNAHSAKSQPVARALLVLGVFFHPALLLAQSAPTESPVDIEAAKQEAAAWSYQLQGGVQLDQSGNVQLNEDGSIKTGPASSSGAAGAQVLMQDLTGLSDYSALADPAANVGRAGASAKVSGHVDFPCSMLPGATRSAAGYTFRFQGCEIEDGGVQAIELQMCSELQQGNLCDESDFTPRASYPAGQYSVIDGVSVGIGCNDDQVCRLSVSGDYSVVADGERLEQQAEERNGASETRGMIRDVVNSAEYEQQVYEQAQITDCYADNQASFLEDGRVRTCDGQQEVSIAGGPSPASCTPKRQCLQQVTTTENFNTSCIRSFGSLTTNRCTIEYRTLTCNRYGPAFDKEHAPWLPEKVNDCDTYDLENATRVAREQGECFRWADVGDHHGGAHGRRVCVARVWEESYVFFDEYEYTDCEATPLPLAGPFGPQVCDMTSGNREILSCGTGGWFGRTLPDNECVETGTDEEGNAFTRLLDNDDKEGCGVCVRNARVGFTCRAKLTQEDILGSCADKDLTGCTLTRVKPQSRSGGILLSQREYYSCEQPRTSCTKWRTVEGSCPNIDASYGIDQLPIDEVGDQGAFEQALAAGGVASEFAAAAGSGNPYDPLLFSGEVLTCEKPDGGWLSDVIQNDCCKIGLTKTGGHHISNQCNDDEVKLAAARRNNFVHYIGTYCSKKVGLFNTCVREAEVYCVFPGLLPRLVQEQGRLQLAEAAASLFESQAETRELRFPYYEGAGGWRSPITVNDRQVSVFQPPAYCSDPQTAAQTMAGNPDARPCPASLGLWFATCADAGTCGPLPVDPEGGSAKWQISLIDPLSAAQSPLSRYVAVQGACDTKTAQCQYEVSVLPQGLSGRAVITDDLTFDLYGVPGSASYNTLVGGQAETVEDAAHTVTLGQTLVRVTPPGDVEFGALPPTVPAAVSSNGGKSWSEFALPTEIRAAFKVPGTSIDATGGCFGATGQCSYRFTASIEIDEKPWVPDGKGIREADCSGFTLEELAILDFSKMDLSEWKASAEEDLPSESALNEQVRQMAAQAEAQAGQPNSVSSSNPGGRAATIKPAQGIGPFRVQLTVPSKWPTTGHDPIYGAQVDWGDGSAIETLIEGADGFYATHVYQSPESCLSGTTSCPNSDRIRDRHGVAGPGKGRTLEHLVMVTIQAESGTKRVTLDVRNVF